GGARQAHHAGAGGEGAAGLVGGDVPVGADAQDLQVHSPGLDDPPVVCGGLGGGVGRGAVRGDDGGVGDVDVGGEVLTDEAVVALLVADGQADVLVAQEGTAAGAGEAGRAVTGGT